MSRKIAMGSLALTPPGSKPRRQLCPIAYPYNRTSAIKFPLACVDLSIKIALPLGFPAAYRFSKGTRGAVLQLAPSGLSMLECGVQAA